MMPAVEVTDPDDPRLAPYTRLTDMQLRMVAEPAQGIFMAEGEKVIRRALAAGLEIRSALMAPKWWPGLAAVIPEETPVFLAPPGLLADITGYRVHRGALAVFGRPAPPRPEAVLHQAATGLLLEDLVDHTNVGAIFRSAAGLGVDAILVTARCADPWYRRSVKTSMGAVFSIPWTVVPDVHAGLESAQRAGMTAVALDPAGDTELRQWQRTGPTLLALGTEGAGLSRAARESIDVHISIPMVRGIDSLNVAAAAAVACYALTS